MGRELTSQGPWVRVLVLQVPFGHLGWPTGPGVNPTSFFLFFNVEIFRFENELKRSLGGLTPPLDIISLTP